MQSSWSCENIKIENIVLQKTRKPNCFEEDFVIRKVKHTVPWTYVISDLNGEGTVRTFYEKEYPKTT